MKNLDQIKLNKIFQIEFLPVENLGDLLGFRIFHHMSLWPWNSRYPASISKQRDFRHSRDLIKLRLQRYRHWARPIMISRLEKLESLFLYQESFCMRLVVNTKSTENLAVSDRDWKLDFFNSKFCRIWIESEYFESFLKKTNSFPSFNFEKCRIYKSFPEFLDLNHLFSFPGCVYINTYSYSC